MKGRSLSIFTRLARQRERRVCCVRSSCESFRARRGQHAAAVATGRKLAVLIWHLLSKGESYMWARPALHARKLRDLELNAGYETERRQRGAAHAYNIKSHRDQAARRRRAGKPRRIECVKFCKRQSWGGLGYAALRR